MFCFDEQNESEYGCYTCFKIKDMCIKLPDESGNYYGEEVPEEKWTCYTFIFAGIFIKLRSYWDSDGTLEFVFPDGNVLANYDCKKDANWEWESKHYSSI